MLFQSVDFLIFIAIVLLAFWAIAQGRNRRQVLLLAASYFFYGMYEAWFLSLIVFSTLIDYRCGARIQTARESGDTAKARLWLYLSLAGNLGILCFFKYTDWVFDNLQWVAVASGLDVDLIAWKRDLLPDFLLSTEGGTLTRDLVRDMVLPVGISFYTFQTLSYTIDIYRGKLAPARNLLDFALFVSFFPQLVAGPIVRAKDFLPQLEFLPRIDRARVHEALWRIGCGLTRKIVFADLIGLYLVDPVFGDPTSYSGFVHAVAIVGFMFQIYNDFAGYSEMAIGVAKLFGFDLPENFEDPLRSRSVREFWRRWHISLSSWIRDYIYFPLGGSRTGKTFRNLLITMVTIGLWHGASWLWVSYGLFNAVAMYVETRILAWRVKRADRRGEPFKDLPWDGWRGRLLSGGMYVYFIVVMCGSTAQIRAGTWEVMGQMFLQSGERGMGDLSIWATVIFLGTWGLILLPRRVVIATRALVHRAPTWVVAVWLGAMIAVTSMLVIGDQPFIYFQF